MKMTKLLVASIILAVLGSIFLALYFNPTLATYDDTVTTIEGKDIFYDEQSFTVFKEGLMPDNIDIIYCDEVASLPAVVYYKVVVTTPIQDDVNFIYGTITGQYNSRDMTNPINQLTIPVIICLTASLACFLLSLSD